MKAAINDCKTGDDAKPEPKPADNDPPQSTGGTPVRLAVDPNDKVTIGYGDSGFIAGDQLIPYTIHFENQAAATAAAQEVVVTDQLDANLDWSTFELTAIGFNGVDIDVPDGLRQYTTRVSVATDPNPVDVAVTFDPDTGRITWTMRSVDPVTGDLPEDPLAGFLPPNDAEHRGEGYVSYTVRPKSGLASATAIANQARIVFDANPPIDTNATTNTIDDLAPASSVQTLPSVTSTLDFTDAGFASWPGSSAPTEGQSLDGSVSGASTFRRRRSGGSREAVSCRLCRATLLAEVAGSSQPQAGNALGTL